MSATADALQAAQAAGISVRIDGDGLVLEAAAPPPAAILDLLSRHKVGIVAMLRPAETGRSSTVTPDDGKSGGERWTADDWREFFEERLAVAMIDGAQPDLEARRVAWQSCTARWLDLHPIASDPSRCAQCGQPDQPGNIVPFGIGPHSWLHSRCWPAWYASRKAEAVAALEAMGIAPTADLPDDFGNNGGA